MQLSISNFEKGGLGNLKSSYDTYLDGLLTISTRGQKRFCNIKHGSEGSISNVDMACFNQATNWCLILWYFGSVKSPNSVWNLPWHSAMPKHINVFNICLSINNAKSIEFLGNLKTTFRKIRKDILLFKKEKKCFTQ